MRFTSDTSFCTSYRFFAHRRLCAEEVCQALLPAPQPDRRNSIRCRHESVQLRYLRNYVRRYRYSIDNNSHNLTRDALEDGHVEFYTTSGCTMLDEVLTTHSERYLGVGGRGNREVLARYEEMRDSIHYSAAHATTTVRSFELWRVKSHGDPVKSVAW